MHGDLALLPATALLKLLRRREISPVEVAEACLGRVEELNRGINAMVTLNERLLDEARALESSGDSQGLLYGLPVGVKDTTPTAGLRTTYGSRLYRNHIPAADAVVVQRLRAAGALVLGKTNVPAFAVGGTTTNELFGPTRNPWDTSRTPGGSTGGGAAALACGMIALADGTDLGGSLRIPASYCGVVGLRPSPGLVPAAPAAHLWDRISVAGGMGRTADDVALFLGATSGPSAESPVYQPNGERRFLSDVRAGMRLAYCADTAGIGIQPDIERACRSAAMELVQSGCQVEEVRMDLSYARPAFRALRGHSLLATHYGHLSRLDELGENLSGNIRSALKTRAKDLARAEGARSRIWLRFRDFFERHDALLTPCMAVSPFPVDEDYPRQVAGRTMQTYYDWLAPTSVLSLTGLPVASVPCGLDALGLPVGMQVVGPPFGEAQVLAIARELQWAVPVGLPIP